MFQPHTAAAYPFAIHSTPPALQRLNVIPLGQAMEHTGAAVWIATQILAWLEGVPVWVLQTMLVLLATGFSMVISNVGATVMLVPLVVNIALEVGADPGQSCRKTLRIGGYKALLRHVIINF